MHAHAIVGAERVIVGGEREEGMEEKGAAGAGC